MIDNAHILMALASFTFGVYLALTISSFIRNQLNGFKASLSFTTIVVLIVCIARVTEEELLPLFYAQVLVYLAFMLNAYTFYKAMNPTEFKPEQSQ